MQRDEEEPSTKKVGEDTAVEVYNDDKAMLANGIELSLGKQGLLTLVGRDSKGKNTFVMTLATESLGDSIRISGIEVLREESATENCRSKTVVAVLSEGSSFKDS